jgi:hypothetical protein
MSKNVKELDCLICGEPVAVDAGTVSAVCGSCTSRAVGGPVAPSIIKKEPSMTKAGVPRKRRGEGKPYVSSGFPRGWHFKKKYVHTDGQVYSKGKLVTDPEIIKHLED